MFSVFFTKIRKSGYKNMVLLIAYIAAVVVIAAVIILVVVLKSNKKHNDQIYEVNIPVPQYQAPVQPAPQPENKEQFNSGETMYLFQGNANQSAPAAQPVQVPVPRNTYVVLSDVARLDKSFKELISPAKPVLIGRKVGAGNVFVDYDQTISGTHCRIDMVNGRFYLSDMNSMNGTYLDSVKIGGQVEINNGQVIQMGAVQLRFSFVEE